MGGERLAVAGSLHLKPTHRTQPPRSPHSFALYLQEKEEAEQRPVFTEEGFTFVYVKYNNLYLLSVTKRNANVALMLVYLYRLVDVFKVRPSLWTPCIVCGKEMAAVWLRRLRSGWGIEASSPGDLSRPLTTITRPIRTTSGSLRRRASGTTSSSSTSSWTRPWTSGTRRPPRPRYYGAFGVDGPTLLVPFLPDQRNLT